MISDDSQVYQRNALKNLQRWGSLLSLLQHQKGLIAWFSKRERGPRAHLSGFWAEREMKRTAKSGQLHLRPSNGAAGDLYCGLLGV